MSFGAFDLHRSPWLNDIFILNASYVGLFFSPSAYSPRKNLGASHRRCSCQANLPTEKFAGGGGAKIINELHKARTRTELIDTS